MAIYYRYRKEPRLEPRSVQVTFASYLVTLMCFTIVCFRKTIVDDFGQSVMPCRVLGWLYVSMSPLQSGVSLVRLINLLNRARYAKYARRMRRVIHNNDDAQSVVSGETDEDRVEGEGIRAGMKGLLQEIARTFVVVRSSFSEAYEFSVEDDDEEFAEDDVEGTAGDVGGGATMGEESARGGGVSRAGDPSRPPPPPRWDPPPGAREGAPRSNANEGRRDESRRTTRRFGSRRRRSPRAPPSPSYASSIRLSSSS